MIKPRARLGTSYQLDSSWYVRADKKIGRPGIIGGEDLNSGDRILIKQWRREATHAEELREMWAHEIRQLHSLSGTAGASDMIIPMVDSGEDDQSFYLILRLGRRSPLQDVLDNATTSSWLRLIRQRQSRILLWLNLKRIAIGLNILHSQGILHRHLDHWAIFTDGGEDPDFQLGGFEWSLRLVDVETKKKRHRMVHPGREYYSFIDDWRDLGVLMANLLDIKLTPNKRDFAQDISFLEPAERALLRTLILVSNYQDVDQEGLLNLIEDAIDASDVADSHEPSQLVLACNLAPQSYLAKAVARASEGVAAIGDQEKQRLFIEADLADTPLMIERKSSARKSQFVLQGSNLTYELKKFSVSNKSDATWDIAYCDRESRYLTSPPQIINRRPVKSSLIRVVPLVDVRNKLRSLRNDARRWDRYLNAVHDAPAPVTRQDKYHAALVLLLLLESQIHRASILPVSIESHLSIESDLTEIHIIPRRDEQRDALAQALGLDASAKRMRRLFEDGDVEFDSEWILSETDISSDEHAETTRWKFVDVLKKKDSQPLYRFQGDSVVPLSAELFLYSIGLEGTDRLMRRHGKALSALRDHEELLGVLEEPRQFHRRTSDEVIENSAFKALDDIKKDVLKNAFNTLPLYLVQGPPGVGKTKLVAALAEQQFVAHSSSRLLLTAQSHQTVDHLLEKVTSEVCPDGGNRDLLMVRCRPRDTSGKLREYDLFVQTKCLIHAFALSPLVQLLPESIKLAVKEANSTIDGVNDTTSDRQGSLATIRAIESLVLRSANLVFSTTNAADLERLIEERVHFDLSLIEEAAKATGVEIVSPLMLSHKRIAIGDHKQLPPFESERREVLLRESGTLKDALNGGWPMVAASFRSVGLDDIVDWMLGLTEDDFAEIVGISRGALTLFQTMVERELERQHEGLPLIAQRLNIQHRMHPVIASLVGFAFYDGDLSTDRDAEKRFGTGRTPIASLDEAILPPSPVLFIDIPYVQKDVGVSHAEAHPPYHNPREVGLVLRVLELLTPQVEKGSAPPSLAVLSPYKEQMHRISNAISEHPRLIEHLEVFSSDSGPGIHVGTVDSFQGNEADVIVISLVRNNHRSGPKALGFLRDARRMNVLLSRGKWQLIIIGSFEFLQNCISATDSEEGAPLSFLWKFITQFQQLEKVKMENGVPAAMRIQADLIESIGHEKI